MDESAPIGPGFAEEALALLMRGEVADGVRLCRAGTERFPWYATGHWVLGRLHEAAGEYSVAATCYARVLQIHPGLATAEEALEKIRSRPEPGESGVDFLLRQLDHVKRPPPPDPASDDEGMRKSDGGVNKIVTATLAEIYARQGAYGAAVEAYRMLIRQRPEEAGRHTERLAELERLLQGVDKFGQT